MTVEETFSNNLKQLIKENHLTAAKLSEDTHINVWSINNWNSKHTYPKTKELVTLSRYFGVSIDYLINDHEILENPYWEQICRIERSQREKGIETYGQGLECNTAEFFTRLRYLEEELVDALVYIEWIKDMLTKKKG